jgi:hypothetical protein
MAGKLKMGLKLLSRHGRTRGVQLGRTVEATNAWEPGVFNAFWERLGLRLDGQLGDGIEV